MDQTNASAEHKINQSADSRAALLEKLLKVAGFHEAYHESVFRCYRKDQYGKNQEVTVTLYDAGKNVDANLRYLCVARTASGLTATGKPSGYADTANENMTWSELDK